MVQDLLRFNPILATAPAVKTTIIVHKCKCLHPTIVWRCGMTTAKDGVLSTNIVFSEKEATAYYRRISDSVVMLDKLLDSNACEIPCGKCFACQMRKRKDMTIRLCHERKMANTACFLTLTYDDDNVPTTDWLSLDNPTKRYAHGLGELPEMTLIPADVQLFMKRLRRYLTYRPKHGSRDYCPSIRYFAVGEYGGKTHRPHYHIIIFGWKPSDAKFFFRRGKHNICVSDTLKHLWKFGFSSVCDVDAGVARYCARYVTKKYASALEQDGRDYMNGVRVTVPEFTLQSVRNGGIGATWLKAYANEIRDGKVAVDFGNTVRAVTVPKYYYDRLRKVNLPLWLKIRDERVTFLSNTRFEYAPDAYDNLLRSCECEYNRNNTEKEKEVF
nr:replication initiation protein [Microvirus sp.]